LEQFSLENYILLAGVTMLYLSYILTSWKILLYMENEISKLNNTFNLILSVYPVSFESIMLTTSFHTEQERVNFLYSYKNITLQA
jgi:hypothetical protein